MTDQREEQLRQYLRDHGATGGAGRHGRRDDSAFTVLERPGEAVLKGGPQSECPLSGGHGSTMQKLHSAPTSEESSEVAKPETPKEKYEAKLRERFGWWCEWAVFKKMGDVPEGLLPKGYGGVGESRFEDTWGAACYTFCESAWESYPYNERPSMAMMLKVFGPFGAAHAVEMLDKLGDLGDAGRKRKSRIVKLVKAAIGSPERRMAGPSCPSDIADEVTDEVDRKHAGRIVLAKQTGLEWGNQRKSENFVTVR